MFKIKEFFHYHDGSAYILAVILSYTIIAVFDFEMFGVMFTVISMISVAISINQWADSAFPEDD